MGNCLIPEMVSTPSRGWSRMSEPSTKDVTQGCCDLFAQATREIPDRKNTNETDHQHQPSLTSA